MLPLHHVHAMTDYEFLRQYYPEDHQIFDDFGDSYYYVAVDSKIAAPEYQYVKKIKMCF